MTVLFSNCPGFLARSGVCTSVSFATKHQNPTVAGLQNQLKIGVDKAEALHDKLEALGVLTAKDEHGLRRLVKFAEQHGDGAQNTAGEQPAADPLNAIDDETYVKVKAKVISEKRISTSFLQSEFALSEEQAKAAIERLEADGVVSEENELGGRKVLVEA